jgi:hypothetical protein
MRDFINFELIQIGVNPTTTLWLLRHKKREGLQIEFTTPSELTADLLPSIFNGALKKYSDKYNSLARKSMTAPQKNYYDKLVEFHQMEGRAPSYEEQCLMLNVKSKGTPHHYAKALERAGWVWFDGRSVIPYEIAEPEIQDETP